MAAAVRTVHLAAVFFVLGLLAFTLLLARPAFARAGQLAHPAWERVDQRVRRWALAGVLAALGSALAWLGIQAALVTGHPLAEVLAPRALGPILGQTHFGRTWQLRVGLVLLAGGMLALRPRHPRDWLLVRADVTLLAGLVVAAVAWSGHAAATEGPERAIHLLGATAHALAAGVWIGGLAGLTLLLRASQRDRSLLEVAQRAATGFSRLAAVAVAVLLLTGAVHVWVLVGSLPSLVGTPYGWLLLAKLALVVLLLGVAAVNRVRVLPALQEGGGGEGPAALSWLIRTVRAELGLALGVLIVVGFLGVTPPGRHVPPTWPFPVRLSWEAVKDLPDLRVWLGGGAAYVAAGLTLLAWSARRAFRPRWAAGLGGLAVLWGGVVGLSALAIDAYPTTYLRPAVPYHALSVANGARLYAVHCAACHGPEGRGDGPAAAALDRPPADLTAKHASDHTAGDLFWWLTYGIAGTPMPGFGQRLSEEERWDLINYLRALGAADQARGLGPALAPPTVAAPDFAFSPGVGRTQTLRDHRGWAIVHLVLFTLPGSLRRLEALDHAWLQLGAAGARVLAVPMTAPEQVYRRLGLRALNIGLAVDGSEEIATTYLLFARDHRPEVPEHVEFLIDRQGYLRARWRPDRDPGWEDVRRLVHAVERLDREPRTAPPPEEHVH